MAFEDTNKSANKGTSPPRFAYKGDRMKPLRAFCQVARLGSVSRAASALFLSQPAITLQLQALERELGVRLFERVGRRLTPTREGEARNARPPAHQEDRRHHDQGDGEAVEHQQRSVREREDLS